MQDMAAFMRVVLWVCGAVIAIGGAAGVIIRFLSPYKTLKKEVRELRQMHAEEIREVKKKLANDLSRFEENELRDNLMMETLFTLVEHGRTNNSTGMLKGTSKKLRLYLIHKKVIPDNENQ